MKTLSFFLRLVLVSFFTYLLYIIILWFFNPILTSTSLIFPYAIHPFDICLKIPTTWFYIKLFFKISLVFNLFFLLNSIFSFIFSKYFKSKKTKFHKHHKFSGISLLVGKNALNNLPVFIDEPGLYQNILVTGTIGSGKTSSSMYPFVKQLIEYNCNNYNKFGMLILDVKGNFFKQVLKYTREFNRLDDLYVIELGGKFKYNPLDKPNLKPAVLANRLKTVLTLFSPNNTESYWLDKAEEVLTECIKLCRLYNDGYVTFQEIHKLVNSPNYYSEKIGFLRNLFKSRSLRYT